MQNVHVGLFSCTILPNPTVGIAQNDSKPQPRNVLSVADWDTLPKIAVRETSTGYLLKVRAAGTPVASKPYRRYSGICISK